MLHLIWYIIWYNLLYIDAFKVHRSVCHRELWSVLVYLTIIKLKYIDLECEIIVNKS